MLIALSAGSTYVFSSYAPQLQEALHLTSTQLNVLGLAGNLGIYMSGPLWGRWIDASGPYGAVLSGAILVLTGYGMLSRAYKYEWANVPVIVIAFFCLLTGLGNSAGNNAAINVQAKSWDDDRRGTAMALVLAAFGLSAFVYSTLSHVFFSGNVTGYLDTLALGSFTCFLVGMALIKVIPPTQSSLPAPATTYQSIPTSEDTIPVKPPHLGRRSSHTLSSSETSARVIDWIQSVHHSEEQTACQDETTAGPSSGHDESANATTPAKDIHITGWDLVYEVDFWLLFLIMGLVSGSGLLLINNVGTITQVLYDYASRNEVTTSSLLTETLIKKSRAELIQRTQALQVSCISIGNAVGRVLIGVISDTVVRKTESPAHRTYLLLPVVLLAIFSQGLAAWPDMINNVHRLLYISCLTGLMYGTLFGLFPVLVFEWFGMRSFSQNWGWMSFAPVIFGNIYNLMFGHVYDANVAKGNHVHKCTAGEDCYRSVFELTTVGCLVALGVSLVILTRRIPTFRRWVEKVRGRGLAIE